MSLTRLCEIGIAIGSILVLKNILFLFVLSEDFRYTLALEHTTLSYALDYGLAFLFQLVFILYLKKRGFNIAALFLTILLLVNIRYIYIYLNMDLSQLDNLAANSERIIREVLILAAVITGAHLAIILTSVRKLIPVRIYAIIQIILAIILYRQTISPNFEIVRLVQYASGLLPLLIIIQFFLELMPKRNHESELLDDTPDSYLK